MESEMTIQDGIHESNPVIGDPVRDAIIQDGHSQEANDTCAVRCQKMILDEFEGHNHPESDLVKEAESLNIYSAGHGTNMEDTGKLLEAHGIHCRQEVDATAYHLANELAQGHKVIIGVDSSELWDNPVLHTIKSWLGLTGADHAVLVSGIDTHDPEHTKVVITDPGTGHVAEYPIEQFNEAWKASHFFMVATNEPVPSTSANMVNFNYDGGHINDMENIHSEQLTDWLHHMPYPAMGYNIPSEPVISESSEASTHPESIFEKGSFQPGHSILHDPHPAVPEYSNDLTHPPHGSIGGEDGSYGIENGVTGHEGTMIDF
jgi:hypothetical protein